MNHETKMPTELEITAIKARLDAIETAQKANIAAVLEGNRDAREMLEIFQAVKGGFKVLGWLSVVVRWSGYVAGAGTALYGAWHLFSSGGPKP